MKLGREYESIASTISKAYFSWILKALMFHLSALSYRTVKLRGLGTLLCLVLSNFRAPKRSSRHGETARNTVLGAQIVQCTAGGANSSNRTDRTNPDEKNLRNASSSI